MKKETLKKIIMEGGATLSANGRRIHCRNGYQVSRHDCYIMSVRDTDAILDAVNDLIANAIAGDYIGIWVDNGLVYIDISERIQSLKKALKIGKERKQISIYSWATSDCIYC